MKLAFLHQQFDLKEGHRGRTRIRNVLEYSRSHRKTPQPVYTHTEDRDHLLYLSKRREKGAKHQTKQSIFLEWTDIMSQSSLLGILGMIAYTAESLLITKTLTDDSRRTNLSISTSFFKTLSRALQREASHPACL